MLDWVRSRSFERRAAEPPAADDPPEPEPEPPAPAPAPPYLAAGFPLPLGRGRARGPAPPSSSESSDLSCRSPAPIASAAEGSTEHRRGRAPAGAVPPALRRRRPLRDGGGTAGSDSCAGRGKLQLQPRAPASTQRPRSLAMTMPKRGLARVGLAVSSAPASPWRRRRRRGASAVGGCALLRGRRDISPKSAVGSSAAAAELVFRRTSRQSDPASASGANWAPLLCGVEADG